MPSVPLALVLPVPVIAPPVHDSAPVTVTTPLPAKVPPVIIFSEPMSKVELTVAVPLAIFTFFPAALIVPPLTFKVAVPRLTTPPPSLSRSG